LLIPEFIKIVAKQTLFIQNSRLIQELKKKMERETISVSSRKNKDPSEANSAYSTQ
jgi:hypothetical protein